MWAQRGLGFSFGKLTTDMLYSVVSIVMLPFAVLWAVVSISLGRDYRRQARALKESGVS